MPELLDTLYPRRCPSTGQTCLLCPGQATLIACLPADAAHDRQQLTQALIAALDPHVAVPMGALDGGHFLLWRHPDPVESAVLLLPEPDPDVPDLGWCAGGPVGLLDLQATAQYLHRIAGDDIDRWQTRGGRHPAGDGLVALRRQAPRRPAPLPPHPGHHGLPGAAAHRRDARRARRGVQRRHVRPRPGSTDAGTDDYADYQAGLLTFSDGLISLDGDLLVPALSPALVEQSLAERRLYHQRARHYVQSLDPTVVLAAVRCIR